MKVLLHYRLKPVSFYLFIALVAGICLGRVAPDTGGTVGVLLVAAGALWCLTLMVYPRAILWLTLCLLAFSGFYSIQSRQFPVFPDHHIRHFTDSKKYRITGRIVSFTRHETGRSRFVMSCSRISDKNGAIPVTGKINVSIYGNADAIALYFGDQIEFESKIKSIRNFANPGGFDYKQFLQFQSIYGSAWSDIKRLTRIDSDSRFSPVWFVGKKIETLRTGFYGFVVDHTRGSDSGRILISLVTGKKEVLPLSIRDLFSKAGISHLLAISGLHMGIVSAAFFSVFYGVFSFSNRLLITGRARKLAGMLTIIPLVFYALFTGFSPSTQRALIMITVLLLSFISERETDVVSSLCVAGILILLLDAAALFTISFQLSFMAVAFIISGLFLMRPLKLASRRSWVSRLTMTVLVTVFASLGTAPLTAHYFHITSGVGVISNLLFIPLIGFVVLPTGLMAMVLFHIFPGISVILLEFCCHLLELSILICGKLVEMPFSHYRVAGLDSLATGGIYLMCFTGFFLFRKKIKTAMVSGMIALGCLVIPAVQSHVLHQDFPGVEITILDVGQGSSAVITTASNHHILVDGGGFGGLSQFDTGRFLVGPFLWHKGIRHLDYVILTHPENDHLRGLVFILENFSVGRLVKNQDIASTRAYQQLMAVCQKKSIPVWHPDLQNNTIDLGEITLTFFDTQYPLESANLNDNSLVFKLRHKSVAMLFAGDILNTREARLSGSDRIDLDSDILVAPHHGSRTSSTKVFLDQTSPESVVISCGWNNRYGFPHRTILQRYHDNGMRVFRTDRDGAVVISSNGRGYTIETIRDG